MTRPMFTAGQRVHLPSGGRGTVIAPADAAGLVLVELADRSVVAVPAEQLRVESLDELAARAALRPRSGNVVHLGAVREQTVDAEQARPSGDALTRPSSVSGAGQGDPIPPGLAGPADTEDAA